MKVVMLWYFYSDYLKYFYSKYPEVISLPFKEHREKLLDDHFSWLADLSRYLNKVGIDTEFFVFNDEILQKKWAKENNINFNDKGEWDKVIGLEQIKKNKPEILWVTSYFRYFGRFIKDCLSYCKKTVAWIASPLPKHTDLSGIEVLITSHHNMLKDRQRLFKEVIVTRPCFAKDIIPRVGKIDKQYDVTFIGWLTKYHLNRAELLAYLLKNGLNINIHCMLPEKESLITMIKNLGWYLKRGYVSEGWETVKEIASREAFYKNVKIIEKVAKKPVFGMDMYKTLMASHIVINCHIDSSMTKSIGNMRTFETTGAGACLVNDYSTEANELFQPDEEIVLYKTKEEALDKIRYLLNNKDKCQYISKNGQKKTLTVNTVERVFEDIKRIFK